MPDEDEEKMKKMRVRIERDAYSVLLSFKDGASPRQVEQRMDDTLGYTYNSKYHLAGVYDMSQILREHPQVRLTADGKFKIVANEDNHELVALISKQKDNKRKKGGNSGRGRRAATSMGYHHNHRNGFSQGLTTKSSPRANHGLRPISAMNKYNNQKSVSSPPNCSRPSTSSANPRFSVLVPKFGVTRNVANQSFTSGSTRRNYEAPSKSSAPVNQFPGQRPLMRAPTASSDANCSIYSLDSTCSDATIVPSSRSSVHSYPSGHMPSIKEFTDNAKYMMINLHPESIHLSEMTDLYSQEYGISVEPLQLFSKSWMNLAKTTFKEWLQMDDGVVSLKPDWFKKYGSAMNSSMPPKKKPSEQSAANPKPEPNVAIPNAKLPSHQLDPFSPLNPKLPSIQGFRYQPPQPAKTSEITAKMSRLNVGRRPTLRSPEKAQGMRKTIKTSPGLRKAPEQSISKIESFSCETESSLSSQLPSESVKRVLSVKSSTADPHYDARQLRSLKYVEKPKNLINDVDTALNGRADPQLNEIVKKKKSRASWKPNTSFSSKFESTLHANTTPSCVSDQVHRSPSKEPLRNSSTGPLSNGVRMFGQALNALRKQNEPKPKAPQQKLYTVPLVATPVANKKNDITSSEKPESDDGWGIPAVSNKPLVAPVPTSTRSILLPPMSKGSLRNKDRSRPTSICKSISSQDGVWLEKALHATLPDDEDW